MSDEHEPHPIPPGEMKRAWRVVTWAGLLGSTYFLICVTGAPRIKYLTELGATAFDFGVISALGAAVLAFQIVGSVLGNRLRRRRPVWFVLAVMHRLLFIGVLAAPLLFAEARMRIIWIIFVLFCHDALSQVAVPIWFSWMADLVPKQTMSRHWAMRQRFITAMNIIGMVLVAVGFNYFEERGEIILGFSVLAVIGLVLGLVDLLLFRFVPEPENERVLDGHWFDTMLQPLRDKQFRPFLLFMGYWQFAVFMAAPFFGLYMIDYLGLSVQTVQLIGVASALGVTVSSRYWGLLCDSYGFRPVLQILCVAKAASPLAFILIPTEPRLAVPFLTVALFFDGILNAGIMLAMQGPLLKSTPRRNRAMYMAASNFIAIGVMAALAPLLAGGIIDHFRNEAFWSRGPYAFTGYHCAFAISVVLRLSSYPLAARIVEPGRIRVRTVLRQVRSGALFRVGHWLHRLNEAEADEERIAAARRLGKIRNPMAINELIHALYDQSVGVRDAAADALGQIGAAEASEPLARALFDPASGIQTPAARALGRIGSVDSLRALIRNLRNLESEGLEETIDALGRMGNDAAVLPLICLFNEVEDEALRERVATALRQLLREWERTEDILDLLHARRPINQVTLK